MRALADGVKAGNVLVLLRLSKDAVFGDAASATLLIKWENWYSAPVAVWPPADPSHFGLNGPQSFPLIGNISVIPESFWEKRRAVWVYSS